MDNCHGQGYRGRAGSFAVSADCPLHGKEFIADPNVVEADPNVVEADSIDEAEEEMKSVGDRFDGLS
jgi:hypothetical protein